MSDELLPPEGFRQRGPAPRGCRLVMIRHGQCVANAEGLAGGPLGDGGLTELGRAQARALAARLARSRELSDATAFYTSALPRARETGAIIFDALDASIQPVVDERLNELEVGVADGLRWAEVVARYPTPDWDLDPSLVNVPGGESLLGFFSRCTGAIDDLVARHRDERVVLVVHGGFVEQALKYYQGLPGSVRLQPRIEHCSMSEFEYYRGRQRLLRYNDLSPLEA